MQVLINGIARKELVCRRGLRQEDLFSPLMFLLVADSLNIMFQKAERQVLFKTNQEVRSLYLPICNTQMIHLFEKCHIGHACVIKGTLVCFEVWSGLKIISIRVL